jgi:hypothetical protein
MIKEIALGDDCGCVSAVVDALAAKIIKNKVPLKAGP